MNRPGLTEEKKKEKKKLADQTAVSNLGSSRPITLASHALHQCAIQLHLLVGVILKVLTICQAKTTEIC